MEATVELVQKTSLERAAETGSVSEIKALIARKEKAMEEAAGNADFYAGTGNEEFAANEAARRDLLARDIKKLKQAIENRKEQ